MTKPRAVARRYLPGFEKIEASTASEHRRTTAPRGLVRVTDRMVEALRRHEAGETTADLAKAYGVSKSLVHGWYARVREARLDARRLGSE